MDRNVFAMIAATVFLLTMIIATIQMQLSMIEKAAEEVETDFGSYAYPIAGAMHVIKATESDSKLGYLEKSEFQNRLSSYSSGCALEKKDGSGPVPGFAQNELLKIKSAESFGVSCGSSSIGGLYTELRITVMRKESGNINPESIEVSQNLFTSGLLGR